MKILRTWISAEVNLCKPGASLQCPCSQAVGATRRGCWRGWNKAEVLVGGCGSLPLWLCVPLALLGQDAWHGGAGLVGRELGDGVCVALRDTGPAHGCAGGYETPLVFPVQQICRAKSWPCMWLRVLAVPVLADTALLLSPGLGLADGGMGLSPGAQHLSVPGGRMQGINGSFHGADFMLAEIAAAAGAAPALPGKAGAESGPG